MMNLETKIAILKLQAARESVHLPDTVAVYIAGRITSDSRGLEGALIRVIAYASLTSQELTLGLAQQVLDDIVTESVTH